MDKPRPLQPLAYPFTGVQAIEASAGTGKTWTIEALYLRLLLGHDCTRRNPKEILVVTFTNAATEELQNRIRDRIAAAARTFRGTATATDAQDAFLDALRGCYPADDHEACAQNLELAMQWMDDAAIHTIHGWCHKVLQRFPLASNSLGAFEVTDDDELLLEVLRDYWRLNCLDLPAAERALFQKRFKQPEDLLSGVKQRIHAPGSHAEPLAEYLIESRASVWQALEAAKQDLREHAAAFASLVNAARDAGDIPKSRMRPADLQRWLQIIDAWASGEPGCDTSALDKPRKQFTSEAIRGIWQGADPPVDHPFVRALDTALECAAKLDGELADAACGHAAGWCAPRLETLKHRRGIASSDDLVQRVANALDGSAGSGLADRLRDCYPVALIDEFQDTDPEQWLIFSSVWQGHDETSLTLIGDPKQSIYAFRGADVQAYLDARDSAQAVWMLDTNYRSSNAMVAAVNRVFTHADGHAQGAFLQDRRIRFETMEANGRPERFVVDDADAPALTFWHDSIARNGDDCRATLARVCAWEIYRLLTGQRTGFRTGDALDAVQPRDIAVLVRNWREAEAMRRALALRGIRSVYLSEHDSVYASDEARQVLQLLQACAWPRDERLVRTALALPLLHRPLEELGALRDDETRLEQAMQRFLAYHELWRERGVLSVLYRVAYEEHLLGSGADDRSLTNYLHLADLLQNESAEVDGEAALLRVFAEHIEAAQATQSREAHVVRLESDDEVVRVVTVFKSKGLEYPLVFLPFATVPPPGGIELSTDETAEQQRLLYVALTRGRHACWVGVVPTLYYRANATHAGLLGYVLGGGARIEPDTIADRLETLRGEATSIALAPLPRPGTGRLPQSTAHDTKPARAFTGAKREAWWVGSYSALELGPRRYEPVGSALEQALADADEEAPGAHSADAPIHRVARGADTGNFLHKLLEWAAATGFAQASDGRPARIAEITRRCRHRFDADAWAQVFDRWLEAILTTPLPTGESRFALSELEQYRSELEFWFGARRVDARRLDDLVTQAILPGHARPGVEPGVLNGMLKGYIDLVFEHHGRYYVADFKSNALGDSDAAYTAEAMAAQLLKKRYDLQLCIYTLALHRLLRTRLGAEYDYDTHIGGALYLYLRGIHEPRHHGAYTVKPPRALIDSLDRLFDGREANHVA